MLLAPLISRIITEEVSTSGCHAAHLYAPTRAMVGASLDDVVRTSVDNLVATLCQPGGRLPPGSDKQLSAFLSQMLVRAIDTPGSAQQRLWTYAPIEEALPLLFELAGRGAGRRSRDRRR